MSRSLLVRRWLQRSWVQVVAASAALPGACPAYAGFATSVVSYAPGTGTSAAYNDPTRALGEPSRLIPGEFGGAVTPFQAPYQGSQLVQVGRGGSLVVRFSTPITNNPANPFGIDLLVFGNAFLPDASYPDGISSGQIAAEGGDIDVSPDGISWFRVASNAADGLYPTLGYSDLTDAYSVTPGSVLSDFARPVDPSFAISAGLTFAQIVAGYSGSGGGFGVDIGASPYPSISFVRISVDAGATFVPEIDGFSVVPAPSAGGLFALGLLTIARRRRSV